MNPLRKVLRRVPISRVRKWARKPEIESAVPMARRLRNMREWYNPEAATKAYEFLSERGYFTQNSMRTVPRPRMIVGSDKIYMQKSEPVVEHFLEMGAIANELGRRRMTPEEREYAIKKISHLMQEMMGYRLYPEEYSAMRHFRNTGPVSAASMVAARMAMNEMGIPTNGEKGANVRRNVAREIATISTYPIGRRLLPYFKKKTARFLRLHTEIQEQIILMWKPWMEK